MAPHPNQGLPLQTRFWMKVRVTDTCWLWTAALDDKGYGILQVKGRATKAHRVAWELRHGPIRDGLFVLHKCDVPRCVRWSHLVLGDHDANMSDMVSKHRARSGTEYITREMAFSIRDEYSKGGVTHAELATAYGVGRASVSLITRGLTWHFHSS